MRAGPRRASAGRRALETEMVPSILKGGRGLDRLQRGDPARLLQHRLLRRAVLDQPPDRPARRRPRAAQLRPDPLRHRPVPPRLRRLPRHRGPARRHQGLLPHRPPHRPLAGARPRLAARPRGRARRRVLPRRGGTGPPGLRRQLRPLPFQPARDADRRRPHGDRPGRPHAAARLARQRRDRARLRDRHLSRPRAALQPHGEPGLGGIRLADRAVPPGRPAPAPR